MNRKPAFNIRSQLRTIPIQNRAMSLRKLESGDVVFSVPAGPPGGAIGLLKTLLRVPHVDKTIRLDTLGSEVLTACDGKNTVEKIVELLADRHKLTFHEARVSVVRFLEMLLRTGAVAVSVPKPISEKADRGGKCAK